MSLTLVAVPIGNLGDITLRALETLKTCDLIIGEERKPMFKLLKSLGLPTPENFELLNEHSEKDDILRIAKICSQKKVALITDCGTPGFSDPGAELVKACRKLNTPVTSNPGASSLTTFISLTGVKLKQFHFEGFLPRESSDREKRLKQLSQFKLPIILMDTPYRLKKTLGECSEHFKQKYCVLGMDLTKENEEILSGSFTDVIKKYDGTKREFLMLIKP